MVLISQSSHPLITPTFIHAQQTDHRPASPCLYPSAEALSPPPSSSKLGGFFSLLWAPFKCIFSSVRWVIKTLFCGCFYGRDLAADRDVLADLVNKLNRTEDTCPIESQGAVEKIWADLPSRIKNDIFEAHCTHKKGLLHVGDKDALIAHEALMVRDAEIFSKIKSFKEIKSWSEALQLALKGMDDKLNPALRPDHKESC